MKKESLFIRILRNFKTDSRGYPIAGSGESPVTYSSTYRRNQPGFDNLNYAFKYDIDEYYRSFITYQYGSHFLFIESKSTYNDDQGHNYLYKLIKKQNSKLLSKFVSDIKRNEHDFITNQMAESIDEDIKGENFFSRFGYSIDLKNLKKIYTIRPDLFELDRFFTRRIDYALSFDYVPDYWTPTFFIPKEHIAEFYIKFLDSIGNRSEKICDFFDFEFFYKQLYSVESDEISVHGIKDEKAKELTRFLNTMMLKSCLKTDNKYFE